jgi:23S rRNA (uracil1939-C5)-methyltransferase
MVVGLEYVPESIENAKENAVLNGIDNVHFHAGDIKDLMDDDFIKENGSPDVIITDPPRSGMHGDVVKKIAEIKPNRLVYVSCDSATQARDIALLEGYKVARMQPVDMFPHTSHVENVALLLAV